MRLTRLNNSQFSYEHDNREYVGQLGLLVVGPRSWPTVENWNVDTKLLPDLYQAEFGLWTAHSGKKRQAIRFLLSQGQFENIYPPEAQEAAIRKSGKVGARGRIYIHPANYPHQLEGCVAPGRVHIKNGVGESVVALNEIFTALGGWEQGKPFEIEVF